MPETIQWGENGVLDNVHDESDDCKKYGCSIHNPSDHKMKDWPRNWRNDRGLMERICEHGVGHPDPDHLGYIFRTQGSNAMMIESIHGCCGCCHKENNDIGS